MMVSRTGGEGGWGHLISGYKVSAVQDEQVLRGLLQTEPTANNTTLHTSNVKWADLM